MNPQIAGVGNSGGEAFFGSTTRSCDLHVPYDDPFPSAPPAGLHMYALIVAQDTTIDVGPSGWSLLESGSISAATTYAFYYKESDGSDPAYILFDIPYAATGWWMCQVHIIDADGGTPIVGAVGTSTGSTCTAPLPTISGLGAHNGCNLIIWMGQSTGGWVPDEDLDYQITGGGYFASGTAAGLGGVYRGVAQEVHASPEVGYTAADNAGVQVYFPAHTSGPFSLGIWRYDAGNNRYALFKNGELVERCIQNRAMGDKTFISIIDGNPVTTTIDRVEWWDEPGGTLLMSHDCDDILDGFWYGVIDEPSMYPPYGSGWRNGAIPGTFDAHDGGGFGKIISVDEPVGCEYVEVQGIYFDIDGDNDWFGITIHAIAGNEFEPNYDPDATGGALGRIVPDPPYEATMEGVCTAPIIDTGFYMGTLGFG